MRLFSGANRVGEKTILGANVLLCASKRCRTPLLINMPQPLCSSILLVPICDGSQISKYYQDSMQMDNDCCHAGWFLVVFHL